MAALRNGGDHARRASAGSGGAGGDFDMRLMARTLGGLFVAGSTLVALTLALPQSPRANVAGLLAIVGLAYLVGGLLLWRGGAVPRRLLPLAPAFGSTLVTGFAYFSAQDPSPMIFFYLWVFLYCAYFFTARETMAQVAYVGVAYGALLIARDPAGGIAEWWIIGMGTPLVAAILIRYMREQGVLLIARLHEAARIDPLTKLSNRQAFRELLDLEIERARRGGTPMTIVVGDLDNFKEVNDRSGPHVGDAALQRLARLLEGGTRQIDGLARVGGEEFALILPDTDAHAAFIIAERLRCSVRAEFAADAVPVTISFGAASHPSTARRRARFCARPTRRSTSPRRAAAIEPSFTARRCGTPSTRRVISRDIAGERFVAVVLNLAEAVDLRFSGSARHSETVGRYAEMMARELGLS